MARQGDPAAAGRRLRNAHPRLTASIGVAGALMATAYVAWRLLVTGRGIDPVRFWLLFAAELYGIVSFFELVHTTWRLAPTGRPSIRTDFSVDVFVCTYDESPDVVGATLAGARAITYPHTTYLLDDGRRPEMRELARRMGAEYLARPDNEHAKAGNINHALGHTDGDLVLILDADHVPLAEVLDATVGYFEDPRMAVVQTPHDFYNRDSVQHTLPDRHEQSLFYNVIAPGKARHNAAYWCGSAAVIRRAALAEVGGVLTDTIAEDFHTTIAMHSRGWRSAYHNEVLVQGLAPHDLDSFLLQRDRWARGNLWVFRTRENPLTVPGLSLRQRISYLGSLFGYLSGVYRLVLMFLLVTTLLTGRLPLAATPAQLAVFWLPWMGLTMRGSMILGRGSLGMAEAWRYGLVTMEIFSRAVVHTLLGRRDSRFVVTPKSGRDSGGLRVLRSLRLLTATTAVLVLSVLLRAAALLGWVPLPAMDPWPTVITSALAVLLVGIIGTVVVPLVRRRQHRRTWRFPVSITATCGGAVVRLTDLTPEGAGVLLARRAEIGEVLELRLRLPGPGGQDRSVVVNGEVRSSLATDPTTWRSGVRFVDPPADTRALILHHCYVEALAASLRSAPPEATPAAARTELSA